MTSSLWWVQSPLFSFILTVTYHSIEVHSSSLRIKSCGTVGRAVASDTSDPRFKSRHRQSFIHQLYNSRKDENKDKNGGNSLSLKRRLGLGKTSPCPATASVRDLFVTMESSNPIQTGKVWKKIRGAFNWQGNQAISRRTKGLVSSCCDTSTTFRKLTYELTFLRQRKSYRMMIRGNRSIRVGTHRKALESV